MDTQTLTRDEFEGLLAGLVDSAYGTAFHLTRNRDDAEDLVQEASVRAYAALGQFRRGTNFRAWFFKILTTLFFQRHRRRKREPEIAPLQDVPELYLYLQSSAAGLHVGQDDPAGRVMDKFDSEAVSRAIGELPEEFRVVAVLYFMQDLAYQEIANLLEIPVGTVRSRLHRGRRLLQKALWDVAVERGILPPSTSPPGG